MAIFPYGMQLTPAGELLNAKIIAHSLAPEIEAIVVGDGIWEGPGLPTAMVNPILYIDSVVKRILPNGVVELEVDITRQAALTGGFLFREIGVITRDPDDGLILHLYANAGDNYDTIPGGVGPSALQQTVIIPLKISNAQNVIINHISVTLDLQAENIGPPIMGAGVFAYKDPTTLRLMFKRLRAGRGIVIDETSDAITISLKDGDGGGDGNEAGIEWTLRSGHPGTWSVCYGNGLFVAVSLNGSQVMTSLDGITWTLRTTPGDNNWTSVCYGNGLFVAVAILGTNRVMTSPDGINWTLRTAPGSENWWGVCYGNGMFVAVGASGAGNQVMTSPDGINWTQRATPAGYYWYSVCYGNGMFVAVGIGGVIGGHVMTSPDGINWTPRATSTPDNSWRSVCYGNGLFVAVSAVAYSGTGNSIMTSPDGINWTLRDAPAEYYWISVYYGNGLFVAVARDGSGNQVMTSPDGINWTLRDAPTAQWNSVCFGNDIFVAVADGSEVMTSP